MDLCFYLHKSFSYSEKGECALNSCAPFKAECLCHVSSESRPKEHPSAWKRCFMMGKFECIFFNIACKLYFNTHPADQTAENKPDTNPSVLKPSSKPFSLQYEQHERNNMLVFCRGLYCCILLISGLTAFTQTISGIQCDIEWITDTVISLMA